MTESSTARPRGRRADAERNREKILAAARAAFGEPGADVSMAQVARRAGVGMATLYRNFPGRRELLEALYTDEVDALCRAGDTAALGTPGERFTAWIRQYFAYFTSKRPIATELLAHVGGDDPVFGNNRARVLATGEPLLDAAQSAGEIRRDLNLEQILDMTIAIAKLHGDAGYVEPMLLTMLDGLRPANAT